MKMIIRFAFGIVMIFAVIIVVAQDTPSLDRNSVNYVFAEGNDKLEANIVNTVEDLVERAKQGGKVEISAGNYLLDEPLILSNDVELIGVGRDQTFIVSTAEHFGVGFEGSGNFKAQSITFEHKGELTAHVVWIYGGSIDINDCSFIGGVIGKKSIDVQLITHRTKLKTLQGNNGSGIAYFESAGGMAVNNISEGNGWHGIYIKDEAQPRLENNTLRNNELYGIHINSNGLPNSLIGQNTFSNNKKGDTNK